jgi:2-haloacid dehalogenase
VSLLSNLIPVHIRWVSMLLGIDAFGLRREEILFAAFAGWDAAGVKAFGFPTFWVNRQNQPAEELGFMADHSGTALDDLVHYIGRKPYS